MIVENGAKIIGGLYLCSNQIAIGSINDIEGTTNSAKITQANISLTRVADGTSSGLSMIFGESDQEANYHDEALYGLIANTFELTGTCGYLDGRLYLTATVSNTSNSDVVIKEIGVVAYTNSAAGHQAFLVARKVIPARQVTAGGSFTYTWAMDFAENRESL